MCRIYTVDEAPSCCGNNMRDLVLKVISVVALFISFDNLLFLTDWWVDVYLPSERSSNETAYDEKIEARGNLKKLYYLIFLFQYLPDCLEITGSGVLRACGWNSFAAWVFFVQHYFIGLGFCLVGVIYFKSVLALWAAFCVDLWFGWLVTWWGMYCKIDWQRVAEEACERLEKDGRTGIEDDGDKG